jgi:pimeloyl-ACP methyl ester carboxylesterase
MDAATAPIKSRSWSIWIITALAMLAVAIAINTLWVDSETRAAVARDGGQLIDTSVVTANVKVEGAGPAIVLIHGFSAAIDWWDEIAPALAAEHRVIRIDLIGHGGTAAPGADYSIERQGALVSAVLDKLGVDRVTAIGHSMGGEVATALAEIKPQRIERMILIDSPPIAETNFTFMTEAYLTRGLGELLSHFENDAAIRRGLAQGFAPGFAVPEKFVADVKQLTYTAFRTAHDESIAYRRAKPTNDRIATLKPVPSLLAISGSLDAIVPPANARLFERVPGAKVAMIESVGHSPMVEAPAQTLELIQLFLRPAP